MIQIFYFLRILPSLSYTEMMTFTHYFRHLKLLGMKAISPSQFYKLLLVDILVLLFLQSLRVRSIQCRPVHNSLNPANSRILLHFA